MKYIIRISHYNFSGSLKNLKSIETMCDKQASKIRNAFIQEIESLNRKYTETKNIMFGNECYIDFYLL